MSLLARQRRVLATEGVNEVSNVDGELFLGDRTLIGGAVVLYHNVVCLHRQVLTNREKNNRTKRLHLYSMQASEHDREQSQVCGRI